MKVIQINAVNGMASTGRSMSELESVLEARGIQSRSAYSYGIPSENGFLIGTKIERMLHSAGSRVLGRQA